MAKATERPKRKRKSAPSSSTQPPAPNGRKLVGAAKRDGAEQFERRFVEQYLISQNATAAYKAAGGQGKSVGQLGYQALQRPSVQAALAVSAAARAERAGITGQRVIEELAQIALQDLGELFDSDGHLLPVNEMPERARRALGGMEVESRREVSEDGTETVTTRTAKVKALDKTKALELLGRFHKLFVDRVEVTAADDLLQAMALGAKQARLGKVSNA